MHQDYVLRMIQQMGLFVTHLLKKRREGDDEGALIEIQEAYGRMTGLHASLVYGLSEDDVVNMLTVQGAGPSRTSGCAWSPVARGRRHLFQPW